MVLEVVVSTLTVVFIGCATIIINMDRGKEF